MAVKPTKEVVDGYLSGLDEVTLKKIKGQIWRPEVEEYEEKLGKQIFDMNEEELIEMICTFGNRKSRSKEGIQPGSASFRMYVSLFRNLFQYYIENCELISNPFNTTKFKRLRAKVTYAEGKGVLSYSDVENVIKQIHQKYTPDKANYLECIILLFYNGFSNAREIVDLKEEMINFRTGEVILPGRVIRISPRCQELLMEVHNMESMTSLSKQKRMVAWHSGYFKHIIDEQKEDQFQELDAADVGRKINARISIDVARTFSIDINYKKLHYLGFYDFLVKEYGKTRTVEIIKSNRDSEAINDLMIAARKYGMVMENFRYFKTELCAFI